AQCGRGRVRGGGARPRVRWAGAGGSYGLRARGARPALGTARGRARARGGPAATGGGLSSAGRRAGGAGAGAGGAGATARRRVPGACPARGDRMGGHGSGGHTGGAGDGAGPRGGAGSGRPGAGAAEQLLGEWLHAVLVRDAAAVDAIRRWHEQAQPGPLVLLPSVPGPRLAADGHPLKDDLRVDGPAAAWVRALLAGHEVLEGGEKG